MDHIASLGSPGPLDHVEINKKTGHGVRDTPPLGYRFRFLIGDNTYRARRRRFTPLPIARGVERFSPVWR